MRLQPYLAQGAAMAVSGILLTFPMLLLLSSFLNMSD